MVLPFSIGCASGIRVAPAEPGGFVTKRTLGILATMVGSAVGAWWLTTYRRTRAFRTTPERARGTVIFDNTPVASDTDAIL